MRDEIQTERGTGKPAAPGGAAGAESREELYRQEDFRRSITENSPDYILQVDPEGRVLYLNRAFPGVSAEKVAGNVIYDYLPQSHRVAMQECLERVLSTGAAGAVGAGAVDRYEAEHRTPDGGASWFEARVGPVVREGRVVALTVFIRDITETKLAQAALEKSEERYRALVEANPDLMFRLGRDGTVLDYSAADESALAIPAESVIGSNIRDLALPPDVLERMHLAISRALEARELQRIEYSLPMLDGRRFFEARIASCASEEVVAIVRDVTVQLKAEEALRESQKRYSLATSAARVGVWDWNVQTGEFYIDPNIKKMLGYSDSEIPNDLDVWINYVHPDDREPVMAAATDTLEGRTPEYVFEHRMLHKDGSVRWVMVRGQAIRDKDGSVIRMVGTDTDITERKEAEEALGRQRQVLQRCFDHLPVMVTLFDPEGQAVVANREVERVMGDCLSVLGDSAALAGCFPDHEYRREFLDHLQGATSEWRDFKMHVDGELPIDVSWACVMLPDGGRLAIGKDISEHRAAEREREDLGSQLRHAQKMEALGTLAGGIAHDLNNILLAITGFSELALYDVDRGARSQKDNIEQILTAARRAGGLVERILSFSRHRHSEVRALDACGVVSDALKLLRASVPANVEFRTNLDPAAGRIRVDENQLHQVVLNLGSNASQAIGDVAGVLDTGVDAVEVDEVLAQKLGGVSQGRYVRISMSDSGSGMDAETLKRIYDPFFTTKAVGEGTGLGLSVVHGIVQSHGGGLRVESEVSRGTSFEVYLPAVDDPVGQAAAAGALAYRGNERVLLVDDEPQVAKVGQLHLERLGYIVTTRTESTAALDLFRADPRAYDILVTDQTMPELNGLSLAREVRGIRLDIPILLTTGYSPAVTPTTLAEAGVTAVIDKPYPGHALARAVRQGLDAARELAD